MSFKKIIVHFLLFSSTTVFSQDKRYAEVDSFISHLTYSVNCLKDFDSLLIIIDKKFSDEEQKVRAIYFWITENIAYDGDGLFSGNMISLPEEALKKKRCVCAGYSALLDNAFKHFGLQSRNIVGKARLLDGKWQWDPQSWLNGHAWNAVQVNNQWKLIDATWASGYLWGGAFVKKRNDLWFFTRPEIFLLSHFPFERKWQLVDSSLTEEQFYNQPFILNDFFKTGITSIHPDYLIIKGKQGEAIHFEFSSSKEINIVFLKSESGSLVHTWEVEPNNGKISFDYIVRNIVRGRFYFSFAYKDEKRKYTWLADQALAYFFSVIDSTE